MFEKTCWILTSMINAALEASLQTPVVPVLALVPCYLSSKSFEHGYIARRIANQNSCQATRAFNYITSVLHSAARTYDITTL